MGATVADALKAVLDGDARAIIVALGPARTGYAAAAMAAHPTGVIQCGRGELTAVLVAAGMAAEGRRPIVLLDARQLTGRAQAVVDALATVTALDVLFVVHGPAPPGVRPPAADRAVRAADESEVAARMATLAAERGLRVLLIPPVG